MADPISTRHSAYGTILETPTRAAQVLRCYEGLYCPLFYLRDGRSYHMIVTGVRLGGSRYLSRREAERECRLFLQEKEAELPYPGFAEKPYTLNLDAKPLE